MHCSGRYPKKGDISDSKGRYHSNTELLDRRNVSMKTRQSQPLSAATTNQFTPTGQYFVLDPEQADT